MTETKRKHNVISSFIITRNPTHYKTFEYTANDFCLFSISKNISTNWHKEKKIPNSSILPHNNRCDKKK